MPVLCPTSHAALLNACQASRLWALSCLEVLRAVNMTCLLRRRSEFVVLGHRGGRGRHAFVFARHVNNFGTIAFHVFQAIPFLFELRELLDWSCTATTLTLFDWLKLEDISISLFFVTVSRQNRQRHRLGERQPRYIKFFQVRLQTTLMSFTKHVQGLSHATCLPILYLLQMLSFDVWSEDVS